MTMYDDSITRGQEGGVFVKPDATFAIVPAWLIRTKNQKAILVYNVLATFVDGEYRAFPSQSTISKMTGLSRQTVIRAIADLKEMGALTAEKRYNDNGSQSSNLYTLHRFNPDKLVPPCISGDTPPCTTGDTPPVPPEIHELEPSNKNQKELEENHIVEQVVDLLNARVGTSYKSRSAQTRRDILARLREGYGLDDFKKVIDSKAADWIGTDYQQYLRPQTLFGTKFESYLNAPSRAVSRVLPEGAV